MASRPSDYSQFRDLTKEYEVEFHEHRLRTLADWVWADDSVLDVGCNAGYLRRFLPDTASYYGVDPSAVAVHSALMNGVPAGHGVAESLPVPDASFDVVVLGYILERVADPDLAMREARRVARRLIVGDTTHESGRWGVDHVKRSPDDLRCYNEVSLRGLLDKFGKVCSITPLRWNGRYEMMSFAVLVG